MAIRESYAVGVSKRDRLVLGEEALAQFRELRAQDYFGWPSEDIKSGRIMVATAVKKWGELGVEKAAGFHVASFLDSKPEAIFGPNASITTVCDAIGCETDLVALLILEKLGELEVLVPSPRAIGRLVMNAEHSPEADALRKVKSSTNAFVAEQSLVGALMMIEPVLPAADTVSALSYPTNPVAQA